MAKIKAQKASSPKPPFMTYLFGPDRGYGNFKAIDGALESRLVVEALRDDLASIRSDHASSQASPLTPTP